MKKIKKSPIEQELDKIARREEKLAKQAEQYNSAKWKEALEQKIPEKVYGSLQKAFCKAFELVFEKGTGLIEKTYSKDEMEKDFQIHDYAVDIKQGKKELNQLTAEAGRGNFFNLAVSTIEGVGFGVLGIGLPDIVLFISVILKGTYETAVQYGFSYDSQEERMYILKLLEASMAKGEDWTVCNAEIDSGFVAECGSQETELREQIRRTSDAFAVDMLLAKFVQSLPVVGVLGGISNPIYYRRIMYYVQLKYKKRYLLKKMQCKAE